MAKGPKITDEVINLIASVYLEHQDWRAKEIKKEVNVRLRRVNPKLPPDWPGLSAVQKELTKIRKRLTELPPEKQELDRPWSMATVMKYPIPPEALLSVLEVWVWTRENLKDAVFTIREAQWASRLYFLTSDTASLAKVARLYAWTEMVDEISEVRSPHHARDLRLFSLLTRQEITPEREAKILGKSGMRHLDADLERKWDAARREVSRVSDKEDRPSISFSIEEQKEEVHNERTHSKEGKE
jgi:hypothetical protein